MGKLAGILWDFSDSQTIGSKILRQFRSTFFRSGKSDPVQFKMGFRTGAILLAKMGI